MVVPGWGDGEAESKEGQREGQRKGERGREMLYAVLCDALFQHSLPQSQYVCQVSLNLKARRAGVRKAKHCSTVPQGTLVP
jgi:hypothetical protein